MNPESEQQPGRLAGHAYPWTWAIVAFSVIVIVAGTGAGCSVDRPPASPAAPAPPKAGAAPREEPGARDAATPAREKHTGREREVIASE